MLIGICHNDLMHLILTIKTNSSNHSQPTSSRYYQYNCKLPICKDYLSFELLLNQLPIILVGRANRMIASRC